MTDLGLNRLKTRIDKSWEAIRVLTQEGEEVFNQKGDSPQFREIRARVLGMQHDVRRLESRYNLRSPEPYTHYQIQGE